MSTRFNFGSVLLASIIATIAMTIVMAIFGMNLMKILGNTAGQTGGMAYLIGGIIHFAIGIFYGIIYALFFEPWMKKLPGFLSGALYSLLPFVIALIFIGPVLNLISTIFDKKSSTPCEAVAPCSAYYACQPCAPDADDMPSCPRSRYCEPCRPHMHRCMPRHRCMPHRCMPHHSCMPYDRMGMAPCGGGNSSGWFLSLISHLVYGAFLGLIYRPRIIEETKE